MSNVTNEGSSDTEKKIGVVENDPSWKDVNDIYENGKHRRYSLLFAVNGAAFAIGKLLVGAEGAKAVVLGGITLRMLACAMMAFSLVMCFDILMFGVRMRKIDAELFGWAGWVVLGLFCALVVVGWYFVGFRPPPG